MSVKIVKQATSGDGYAPGYVELVIANAADLVGLKVSSGFNMIDPAPGSLANTSGMAEIYQVNDAGVWAKLGK